MLTTLLCETLMSAKQTINDKLQGSVATYLRCGGILNNQIKKGLLLSVWVNFFKSVNIWQCYKQERGCLMHFARLANTLLKDEESAGDNHVLACLVSKTTLRIRCVFFQNAKKTRKCKKAFVHAGIHIFERRNWHKHTDMLTAILRTLRGRS